MYKISFKIAKFYIFLRNKKKTCPNLYFNYSQSAHDYIYKHNEVAYATANRQVYIYNTRNFITKRMNKRKSKRLKLNSERDI